MSNASDTIVVGKIGASYGIKGWLRITSYTEVLEGIFEFSPWLLNINGENKTFHVEHWKRHNKGVVAKLQGVDDRDQAELIKNVEISIHEEQLPELDENDFYWRDLIGMQVVTEKGYDLGTVEQMFETGANDVMLVKANLKDAFGAKQRMIPYLLDQVVKQVNKEAKSITVDWDPGF